MKVALIHSHYLFKGGEDKVFDSEYNLLLNNYDVKKISLHNKDGFRGLIQFILSIWNFKAVAEVMGIIDSYKPDIVHIHNLHFAIGPLLIRKLKKKNIPIVITLHNYRLLCPSATLMFDDNLFLDSVNSSFPWKAISLKVYKNSLFLTFWLSLIYWFHSKIGTWNLVDKFIVLTDFAKEILINSSISIPDDKIFVKPNFVPRPIVSKISNVERDEHFLFIGRLSKEKGIHTLIEAFKNNNYKLSIAGNGELKDFVLNSCNDRISYLGNLSTEEVYKEMLNCSALIFPSIWFEGMPMTIIESLSLGTSVIASDLGAMSSMISNLNGLKFIANDPVSLNKTLDTWANLSYTEKKAKAIEACNSYENNYTPEINLKLMDFLYLQIINNH